MRRLRAELTVWVSRRGDERLEESGPQKFGDLFRVRFGGGVAHHLAGEEIEELFVSGFDGFHFLRVVGYGCIDERFEFAGFGFLESE